MSSRTTEARGQAFVEMDRRCLLKTFVFWFQNKKTANSMDTYLLKRQNIFDANMNVNYGDFEERNRKLDTDLVKYEAFEQKLRHYKDENMSSIESDINTLDLSKHLKEVSAAVVDTYYDNSSIPVIVGVCSLLHQRYFQFSYFLLEAFRRSLPQLTDIGVSMKIVSSQLIKFSTLLLCGCFPAKEGFPIFMRTLESLVDETECITAIVNLMQIHGYPLTGILPKLIRESSVKTGVAVVKIFTVSDDDKRKLGYLVETFFVNQTKLLFELNEECLQLKFYNRKLMRTNKKLALEKSEDCKEMVARLGKFTTAVKKLAVIVDMEVPKLASSLTSEQKEIYQENVSYEETIPLKECSSLEEHTTLKEKINAEEKINMPEKMNTREENNDEERMDVDEFVEDTSRVEENFVVKNIESKEIVEVINFVSKEMVESGSFESKEVMESKGFESKSFECKVVMESGSFESKEMVESKSFECKVVMESGSFESKEMVESGSFESKEMVESGSFESKEMVESGSFESKEMVESGSFECKEMVESGSFECKEVMDSESFESKEVVDSESFDSKEVVESGSFESNEAMEIDSFESKEVMDSESFGSKEVVESNSFESKEVLESGSFESKEVMECESFESKEVMECESFESKEVMECESFESKEVMECENFESKELVASYNLEVDKNVSVKTNSNMEEMSHFEKVKHLEVVASVEEPQVIGDSEVIKLLMVDLLDTVELAENKLCEDSAELKDNVTVGGIVKSGGNTDTHMFKPNSSDEIITVEDNVILEITEALIVKVVDLVNSEEDAANLDVTKSADLEGKAVQETVKVEKKKVVEVKIQSKLEGLINNEEETVFEKPASSKTNSAHLENKNILAESAEFSQNVVVEEAVKVDKPQILIIQPIVEIEEPGNLGILLEMGGNVLEEMVYLGKLTNIRI